MAKVTNYTVELNADEWTLVRAYFEASTDNDYEAAMETLVRRVDKELGLL